MALAGVRWGRVSAAAPVEVPLQPPAAPAWGLPGLTGRLVELSAGAETAHLTAAIGLVVEAQLGDDRAAWVTLEASSFFPPDVVETGIDLDALPVVRVPNVRAAGRAAGHLLRSNAFGLVVVDLTSGATGIERSEDPHRLKPVRSISYGGQGLQPLATRARGADGARVSSVVSVEAAGVATPMDVGLPVPILSRLLGLAREHDAVVLFLTRKTEDAPSMHSLISLRAEARWRRGDDGYELCVRVIKDKRGGPGWTHTEICRGPAGLR